MSCPKSLIDALNRLEQHQVSPEELVIAQRLSRKPSLHSTQTVAMLAYQRSEALGFPLELASKVRFIVCTKNPENPLERAVLARELNDRQNIPRRIDVQHYRQLAIRAIWAILSPFGWSEDDLVKTNITRLDQWM